MTNPRRQHWVPRLYLREFATPDTVGQDNPDVWLFHKDEGDPFRTSISNVASSSFLYSTVSDSGERDFTVESKLSDLESTIAPIWKQLANDFISLEDSTIRKGVGLFVATLFHRNPQRIDDHVALTEAKTHVKKERIDKTDSDMPKPREALKDQFVHTLLKESRPTAEELISKRWAVIVADQPVFATSDNPVMVLHDDRLLRGLGFFDGDIMVPVSPTRMIMMDDRHNEGNNYYKLHKETVGALHGITFRYALRFLISSRPSDEVLSELVALTDQIDRGEL